MTSILRSALIAALALGCGGGDAEPGAGAWQLNVDTVRSAAGVRQSSYLRVIGQEGPDGEARTRPVILSFDCRPEDATSTIMTDQALRQGTAEARLTVGQHPPRTLPGFAGTTETGGQVVFTLPQDSLLGLLSGHARALIEYADGAGSSRTTAEFPVAGLETVRARFLAACAERGG